MSWAASVGVCVCVCMCVQECKRIFASESQSAAKVDIVKGVKCPKI